MSHFKYSGDCSEILDDSLAYLLGLFCCALVQKRVGVFRKFDKTSPAEEISEIDWLK